MISLFKSKKSFGGLTLLLFLCLIQTSRYLQLFVTGHNFSIFSTKYSIFSFLVTTAVIFGCGILLNNILNRYQFFESGSHLGASVFFLFCAFIPNNQAVDKWLIALVLSVFIFNKIIKARRATKSGRNYFDSAFLLGLICLFFPTYIFYILPILLSMFLVNEVSWSNMKLVITGLLFAFLFWTVYLLGTNNFTWFENNLNLLKDNFLLNNLSTFTSSQPLLLFIITWVITFFFWLSRRRILDGPKLAIIRYSSLLGVVGLIMAISFFKQQTELLIFTFVSFSILVAYFLYHTKAILANVLFLLFTGYAILYPWVKHINLDL